MLHNVLHLADGNYFVEVALFVTAQGIEQPVGTVRDPTTSFALAARNETVRTFGVQHSVISVMIANGAMRVSGTHYSELD